MTVTGEPTPELNEGFSEPGAPPAAWADVVSVLAGSEMFCLSTVRADGRPHVTPLPAVWLDGRLHICTGSAEQKAANLRRDARCVLTTGSNALHDGLDVVVEGHAARVTTPETLARLAARWKSKLDWDFEVGTDAFLDQDGRTGLVFEIVPSKILAFNKGPYTQTRFVFTG